MANESNFVSNNFETFSKNSIRLGATDEYPYVFPCFVNYPERCAKVGSDLEYIYSVLSGMLHLNVIWSNHEDFPALQKALEADEIDLIGNTRILDWASVANETVTQTPVAYYLGIGFFVRSLPVTATLNPFSRFSWDLWVVITVLTLTLIFMKEYIRKTYKFSLVLIHIMFLLWAFLMSLIMALYGNLLTTDLVTSNKLATSFNDLVDLGEKLISKQCRFVIYDKYVDSLDFQIIFNPDNGKSWTNNFKKAFQINPPIIITDKADLYTFVRNSTCAVGLDFVSFDLSVFDNLCGVQVKIFPDDVPFMPYVYYHTLRIYSQFIDDVFASDGFRVFPDILAKTYNYISPTECNSEDLFHLTLSKLYSCFGIFLGGLFVSAIFFIINKFDMMKRIGEICFKSKLVEYEKIDSQNIRPMFSAFRVTEGTQTDYYGNPRNKF